MRARSFFFFDANIVFAVAAGLDSMVVGESQILGQVRHALALAREQGTVDRALSEVGALALQQAADLLVGMLLRGLSAQQQFARLATPEGAVYAALLALFALMPAMVESWRSIGAATDAAIVSGLAPGSVAVIEMVGKSTAGRADTASRR